MEEFNDILHKLEAIKGRTNCCMVWLYRYCNLVVDIGMVGYWYIRYIRCCGTSVLRAPCCRMRDYVYSEGYCRLAKIYRRRKWNYDFILQLLSEVLSMDFFSINKYYCNTGTVVG